MTTSHLTRSVASPHRTSSPWPTWLACVCLLVMATPGRAGSVPVTERQADLIVKARAAFDRRDRAQLASLKQQAMATGHPLAMWADYWELSPRLRTARNAEIEAFLARWPNTHVEDQLRREWILELGKRRDWAQLARQTPLVRQNDHREVACYGLLVRHQAGENVSAAARDLWFAQREADHGCAQLAAAVYQARQWTREDIWARSRVAAEQNRRFVALHATGLLGRIGSDTVRQVFLHPAQFLARRSAHPSPDEAELMALAVIRLASRSPSAAAAQLQGRIGPLLPPTARASAWAAVGKQAAMDGLPQAMAWFQKGSAVADAEALHLTDDTLAWKVRAALRAGEGAPGRWEQVAEAVDAMSEEERQEATWQYWKARALKALAPAGSDGDAQRQAAQRLLEQASTQLHFYAKLAADGLGRPVQLPARPAALTEAERAEARNNASLTRALALVELNLRDTALAEWTHGLIGLNDRGLLAAAQRACEAEVWNRCMSTSERTRAEIDLQQRFPMPYRDYVEAAAREADIDTGYVYSVIRQESHFSVGVRSVVGASGLMQVMPSTARWTARKFRIPFRPDQITDPATNLRIGARYLKTVLDAFEGSHAHAAAAYNAGPGRPRRWRHAGGLDVAAWIEIIPLDETRDYVKGVLSNVAYYGALLNSAAPARPGAGEIRGALPGDELLATAGPR